MSYVAELFMHSASVETFTGRGFSGDQFASAVIVPGFLDDGVVRGTTPGGGLELEARTTFYADLSNLDVFTVQSRCTVNGRPFTVVGVRARDGGALLGAVSHVEVDLR